MKPTKKSKKIDDFLTSLSGRSRISSIESDVCSWCGKPAKEFRNEISRSEYQISGFCQDCQDKIFEKD